MINRTDAAFTYTDLNSLQSLKRGARQGSPEAVQATAQQFEALLLQLMLKGMRATRFDDGGLFNSQQTQFYQNLFDQQLALTLAQRNGLGLAPVIAKQLGGGEVATTPPRTILSVTRPADVANRPEQQHKASALSASTVSAPARANVPFKPTSPDEFVRHMWPHAERVAQQLGVAPEALIAQAALETGWGRAVPQFSDGRSSHNLFGIKADKSWRGERVVNTTLEFIDGLPVQRRDGFRAYGSYAESFADYVDFLRSNPRYQEALRVRSDKSAFVRALQQAGYATDPEYAAKIEKLMDSEPFNKVRQNLKFMAGEPINSSRG